MKRREKMAVNNTKKEKSIFWKSWIILWLNLLFAVLFGEAVVTENPILEILSIGTIMLSAVYLFLLGHSLGWEQKRISMGEENK